MNEADAAGRICDRIDQRNSSASAGDHVGKGRYIGISIAQQQNTPCSQC